MNTTEYLDPELLPFTAEVFFSLLGQYNGAIWPAQIVAGLLGLGALFLACRPAGGSDRGDVHTRSCSRSGLFGRRSLGS